jgi:hypothetical protein
MDNSLIQALGAPDTTTYNNHTHQYEPPPNQWTTDWDAFDQFLKSHSLPVFDVLRVALSIQYTPVPLNVITNVVEQDSEAIDQSILYTAARNSQTSKEVFLWLFKHKSIHHTKILNSLLHECAKSNNIGAAEAIIECSPQSLDQTDQMGFRPIHAAFSYQNQSEKRSDMVRLLLKEGMRHGIGGKNGCGGVFLERANPGSTRSPFELALYYLRQKHSKNSNDCEDEWECLTICLDAAKATFEKFQILSYIITLPVDMDRMMCDIVRRYCIDLNDTDELGMTPLIVAIREKKPIYIKSLLSIQNCAKNPIQFCEINGTRYKNCSPLHIAVNEGITWMEGLKEILESNQFASERVDPETNLYPFMVAAQWATNPLHDVYNLLRSNPGIADSCNVQKFHRVVSFNRILPVNPGKYVHLIIGVILGIVIYSLRNWQNISGVN